MSPALLAVWKRGLYTAGAHARTEIQAVRIDLVGLTVPTTGPATVVVLIEAELHAGVDEGSGMRRPGGRQQPAKQALCQYWTLASETAPKRVARGDANRADYIRRFYDVSPELPTHYDIVLNSDRLSVGQAVEIIVRAASTDPA